MLGHKSSGKHKQYYKLEHLDRATRRPPRMLARSYNPHHKKYAAGELIEDIKNKYNIIEPYLPSYETANELVQNDPMAHPYQKLASAGLSYIGSQFPGTKDYLKPLAIANALPTTLRSGATIGKMTSAVLKRARGEPSGMNTPDTAGQAKPPVVHHNRVGYHRTKMMMNEQPQEVLSPEVYE